MLDVLVCLSGSSFKRKLSKGKPEQSEMLSWKRIKISASPFL